MTQRRPQIANDFHVLCYGTARRPRTADASPLPALFGAFFLSSQHPTAEGIQTLIRLCMVCRRDLLQGSVSRLQINAEVSPDEPGPCLSEYRRFIGKLPLAFYAYNQGEDRKQPKTRR